MSTKRVEEVWSQAGAPWSVWVKPVLFASLRVDEVEEARAGWAGEVPAWLASEQAAMIIDLPGRAALELGLSFGARGYQPVLAINASTDSAEVIDMQGVLALLVEGARFAGCFSAGSEALPAFMLDARRAGPSGALQVGTFDNRWAVFASDLPSGKGFLHRGIQRVVIVQEGAELSEDLAAIAWDYRTAGLDVRVGDVRAQSCGPLRGKPPNWLQATFQSLMRGLSFQRRSDGSFGHFVSPPSSHG